jgi:small subunit ribosomal protein S3
VIASRVASALQRGVHFRRAGFWALNQVMEAGALGAEIVISGKLRTERARFEKFRAGYFPRCGDPALTYMKKAEAHVQLKPGIIGVRVKLMPPDAKFPDKIKITEELPPEEIEEKTEEGKAEKAEKPAETPEQKVKVEELPEEPTEATEEKAEAATEEAPAEEASEEEAEPSAEVAENTAEESAGEPDAPAENIDEQSAEKEAKK